MRFCIKESNVKKRASACARLKRKQLLSSFPKGSDSRRATPWITFTYTTATRKRWPHRSNGFSRRAPTFCLQSQQMTTASHENVKRRDIRAKAFQDLAAFHRANPH